MLNKAAINGPRTRREHPAIPLTPAEQAAEARAAILAGAGAIHVHARGSDGRESLVPKDVAGTLEAGIWNAHAAHVLLSHGLADECLRILIEPAEDGADARANLEAIEAVLGPVSRPRLLHGVDAFTWELVEVAAMRRYDTRTGFEDTLALPDGSRAESNAVLVAAARRIVSGRT